MSENDIEKKYPILDKLHIILDTLLFAFKAIVSFVLKITMIIIVIIGIWFLSRGTTFSNFESLKYIVENDIAKAMSWGLTIAFIAPSILRKMPFRMIGLTIMLLCFSSALAINTFSARGILSANERIESDPTLQYMKDTKNQYDENARLKDENYKIAAENDWTDGTANLRIDSRSLMTQSFALNDKIIERIEKLKEKGSVQQEAFVNTYLLFFPNVKPEKIKTVSDLIFSFLNDLGLLSLWFILGSLVPQIQIEPKKSATIRERWKIWRGKSTPQIDDHDSVFGIGWNKLKNFLPFKKCSNDRSKSVQKPFKTTVQKAFKNRSKSEVFERSKSVQNDRSKSVQKRSKESSKNISKHAFRRTRERFAIGKSVPIIKQLLNAYENELLNGKITYNEIGKIAAEKIGKSTPFKKSYICGVKKGKYD